MSKIYDQPPTALIAAMDARPLVLTAVARFRAWFPERPIVLPKSVRK